MFPDGNHEQKGAILLIPLVGLHVFHHDAKGWAVCGPFDPARPRHVRDLCRGALRHIRPQIVKHYAYVNILRVRDGRPRKFPGKHLPDHDPEAIDVTSVGASGDMQHLRSTSRRHVTQERVAERRCRVQSLGFTAVVCGSGGDTRRDRVVYL